MLRLGSANLRGEVLKFVVAQDLLELCVPGTLASPMFSLHRCIDSLTPILPRLGSANLRSEILKFVVAQDLFELCAPELQPATVAVKKAILKWAGAEQAGAVQLVR